MNKISGSNVLLVSTALVGLLGGVSAQADELNAAYASAHTGPAKVIVACEDQVWPNIDPVCAGQGGGKAPRHVRVISLDRGAPSIVAAPVAAAASAKAGQQATYPVALAPKSVVAPPARSGSIDVSTGAKSTRAPSESVTASSDVVGDLTPALPAGALDAAKVKPQRELIEGRKLTRKARTARRPVSEERYARRFADDDQPMVYHYPDGREVMAGDAGYAQRRRQWFSSNEDDVPSAASAFFSGRFGGF